LKYFLKKNRNITLKFSPSPNFKKSVLNTTYIEVINNNKIVKWPIELSFIPKSQKLSDINSQLSLILSGKGMVYEETSLKSIIAKKHLLSTFINEEVSLFLSQLKDGDLENASVFMKQYL
jgi:hypothetical protein